MLIPRKGEYMISQPATCLESYQKSLQLNQGNANAANMIVELGKGH
jgi:hypothetical protein